MRSKLLIAFWPAVLGVLAAHQVAYTGHDDGHIHGYLETVGPALVVAAVLGWIWSWARSTVDFRSVLAMQTALFAAMEIAERVAASTGFQPVDLAPVLFGLAVIPLASAVFIVVDRVDLLSMAPSTGVSTPVVARRSPDHLVIASRSVPSSIWSIRAPPFLV